MGGIETVTEILAGHLHQSGHQVQVITQTLEEGSRRFPFQIWRRPTLPKMFSLIQWCQVYLQNNISLQTAWPLLLVRRPWVVAHHVWIRRPNGHLSWQDQLKLSLLPLARNVVISQAIAQALPVPSTIVGDPYQEDLFYSDPKIPRDRDLLFVGRLVSDKGVGVLLQALQLLHQQGRQWNLTIVGDGPEGEELQKMVTAFGLQSSVQFLGRREPGELREIFGQHQVVVIPSVWEEPFGIVALEAIACGCLVIGSERGGLKDAIGPCGLSFPNGDARALAQGLERLLTDPELAENCQAGAAEHLAKFQSAAVSEQYLQVLQSAVQDRKERHARNSS